MGLSSSFNIRKKDLNFLLYFPFLLGAVVLPFSVSNIFPYSFKTIKFFIAFLATILGIVFLAFLKNEFYILQLKKRTLYLFFSLIFILIINYFIHDLKFYFIETYYRLIFWSLFLFFLSFARSLKDGKREIIFIPIFLGTALFITLDLFIFIIFAEHPPYFTFGNQNMSAEYVGLVFGLMLGCYKNYEKIKMKYFLDFFIPLTASYIFFTNCRSAYIGIILIIIYFLLSKELTIKDFIKIFLIFITVTSLISLLFKNLHDANLIGLSFEKIATTLERWLLLKNSLKMLLNNPLGIGLGQYEFQSIPYLSELVPILNEKMIYQSPHVEFLRFMIEDGLLASGIIILILLSFFYDVRHKIRPTLKSYPEIAGYFIFFIVQFIFQFPLDNPFPFFMTAFMGAYFLACLDVPVITLKTKKYRKILLTLFSILILGAAPRIFSNYVDCCYPNHRTYNDWACTFDPGNWNACLNVVAIDLANKQYDSAKKRAFKELSKRLLLFPALKYLALTYLEEKNYSKACFYLKKYDDLFARKSSLNVIKKEICDQKD